MVLLGSSETIYGYMRNLWRLGYMTNDQAQDWLTENPLPEITDEIPQEIGEGRVFVTGSKSRPGVTHVTILAEDGELLCLCEGFMYNNGKCRHVKEIKEMLDDGW